MLASGDLPEVIPATIDNLDAIAAVLAAAHQQHPVAAWVVPDPRERPRLLQAWYTILIEHALSCGRVDMLADGSGAAVWLDRTGPLPDPVDYEQRVVAACGDSGLDMLMAEHVGSHHRFKVAHLQLTHIGVDHRSNRARRLGALLEHQHAQLDEAGVLAAAEAATDEDLNLFDSHGYRPAERYVLPDGPLVRTLLRISPRPDQRPGAATRNTG